jgi:hypothetical protein
MAYNVKKNLQEKYNRLKKVLKKVLSPNHEEALAQLILQPCRNKQRFER